MKKFAVIGLGNFGLNLAQAMMEEGCEVVGVDPRKDVVQSAKEMLSHAIIADATNHHVLETLALRDFDGVVVSIGQEMLASILIALYLKEIGVRRIIVRALSDEHHRILDKLGVTDIVFPERDMAVRLGKTLAMRNVIDYLPLAEDYAIIDVPTPGSFEGKRIRDLQIGAKYRCQILGIRSKVAIEEGTGQKTQIVKMAPIADDVLPKGSVMIILGRITDIEKIQKLD